MKAQLLVVTSYFDDTKSTLLCNQRDNINDIRKVTTTFALLPTSVLSSVKCFSDVLIQLELNRDPTNEVQSNVFIELQETLKTSKLSFKEIDCSVSRKECENVRLKPASSYRLYSGEKLVDIYYGPQKVEPMRNYCMAKLGFRMPRSLPVPGPTAVENLDTEFTSRALTARSFHRGVKNGLTFVM